MAKKNITFKIIVSDEAGAALAYDASNTLKRVRKEVGIGDVFVVREIANGDDVDIVLVQVKL